jgi:hypothetical protein
MPCRARDAVVVAVADERLEAVVHKPPNRRRRPPERQSTQAKRSHQVRTSTYSVCTTDANHVAEVGARSIALPTGRRRSPSPGPTGFLPPRRGLPLSYRVPICARPVHCREHPGHRDHPRHSGSTRSMGTTTPLGRQPGTRRGRTFLTSGRSSPATCWSSGWKRACGAHVRLLVVSPASLGAPGYRWVAPTRRTLGWTPSGMGVTRGGSPHRNRFP